MPETKQERDKRREIKKRLTEERKNIQSSLPKIDVKVEGTIDRQKQRDYTMDLFENQARQTELLSRSEYDKNPVAWMQSDASRARLVIIEATDSNANELAKAVIDASPLERVLVVGLEGQRKENFETELRSLWSQKIEASSKEYKEAFQKHFNEPNQSTGDLVGKRTLEELLGPHLQKEDLDISYVGITKTAPDVMETIEEIVCFGHNNSLSLQLPSLALTSDFPYMSVRAEGLSNDDSEHLWRFSTTDESSFLKRVVAGQSVPDMIKGTDGGPNLASVSPDFEHCFKLDVAKGEMAKRGGIPQQRIDNLQQEDLDFLKDLFVTEALYSPYVSPKSVTKIISKATSGIGARGAKGVGGALVWNLVNRPVSTAKGVEFAVGSMTLDGGNDLLKEDLDKKTVYKKQFDKLLAAALEKGRPPKEAVQFATTELINNYCILEKENPTLHNLLNAEGGAEEWRSIGLEWANKVKKTNEQGVNALKPMMPLFIIGTILALGGLGLAIAGFAGAGIPAAVGLATGIVGVTGTLAAGGFLARSMYKQRKANYRYLPRANFNFAQANAKQFDASKEREKVLAGRYRDSIQVLEGKHPVEEVYIDLSKNATQELTSSATEGQSTSGEQQKSKTKLKNKKAGSQTVSYNPTSSATVGQSTSGEQQRSKTKLKEDGSLSVGRFNPKSLSTILDGQPSSSQQNQSTLNGLKSPSVESKIPSEGGKGKGKGKNSRPGDSKKQKHINTGSFNTRL